MNVITREADLFMDMPAIVRPPSPWTEERIALLKELVELNLSATEIGIRLGGLTKSAVASKLDILGIRSRGFHAKQTFKPAKYEAKIEEYLPIIGARNLTLMELEPHHCRFITNNDNPYVYCAANRMRGSSYCSHHDGIVYKPGARRYMPISRDEETGA